MRNIDWDQPLSEEDKAWLRQSGMPMVEQRIKANEEQFNQEPSTPDVPPDTVTRSALDPTARVSEGPVPTGETPASGEDELDDYDDWTVAELNAEVTKRNDDAESEEDTVTVTGTGTNGAVRKPDLIAGLRAWDRDHPS